MDHHHSIIAADARDLLTHWSQASVAAVVSEQQPQSQPEQHQQAGPGEEQILGMKQKSRRSLTEAERGLNAEPNALRPPTTKAGKQRIRMKWSNDVNQFIMRTYYTITSNETQTKSYRDHLHRLFAQQYPDVAISQQRIADQRRAIVKNNLLPKAVLDAIKEEVAQSLQMKSFVGVPVKQEPPSAHLVPNHMPTSKSPASGLLHQQQQTQHLPSHIHLAQQQQQQHPHHPTLDLHSGGHPRIHQAASPTALQNQPHIIIRVNSTNPNNGGGLKHHFGDDGSGL